ncbi:MAG: hypothetical protein U9R24_03720 [Thermodesulfobacteriota bacterium]|nr:hypothetical protein [Thermodesulfobacteriota bacterium]
MPQAGGFGSSEDFAMQMMGSLFGSMLESALAPQPDTTYQQQLLQQKIAAKKKQEAMKKQAVESWKKLQKQEEANKVKEEGRKKEKGRELLAKMGSLDDGGLKPFKWDTPELEAKPVGTGAYDTSGYTSWQRLLCAAYFSSKALEEMKNGNSEGAAFMNTQADRVTAGEMTDVECQLPGLQQLGDVQRQNLKQDTRLTKMVKLMPTIQEKVGHLQEIEIKLNEAKRERSDAKEKFETAKVKVDEAKVQAESAKTPEEKTEADDLLQQALALQDEAEAQVDRAKQKEEEYAKAKEKDLGELKDLKENLNDGTANE